MWQVSPRVFLLDHAATVDAEYTLWRGNWVTEEEDPGSTPQQGGHMSDGKASGDSAAEEEQEDPRPVVRKGCSDPGISGARLGEQPGLGPVGGDLPPTIARQGPGQAGSMLPSLCQGHADTGHDGAGHDPQPRLPNQAHEPQAADSLTQQQQQSPPVQCNTEPHTTTACMALDGRSAAHMAQQPQDQHGMPALDAPAPPPGAEDPRLPQPTQQQPPKRIRRKRKAAGSREEQQEQLDAKHPGNVRNRAAQQVVAAALEQYLQWRQACCSCQPAVAAGQPAAADQAPCCTCTSSLLPASVPTAAGLPALNRPVAVAGPTNSLQPSHPSAHQPSWGPAASLHAPAEPHAACSSMRMALRRRRQVLQQPPIAPAEQPAPGTHCQSSSGVAAELSPHGPQGVASSWAVAEQQPVDWVALAALKHVLYPKVRLQAAPGMGCSPDTTARARQGVPAAQGAPAHPTLAQGAATQIATQGLGIDAARMQQGGALQGDATQAGGHASQEDVWCSTQHPAQEDLAGEQGAPGPRGSQLADVAAAGTTRVALPAAHSSAHRLFGSVTSNDLVVEVVARAHDAHVLLPPNSSFMMTDLTARNALASLMSEGRRFKVVVCDPPWENASVKRSNRYRTLPGRTLLQLPMQRLLDPDHGVLLLWMTNRERLHRFVTQELLPHWGMKLVTTWYWLKLSPGGLGPTSSLTSMHRHPFEHLLVAAPITAAVHAAPCSLQAMHAEPCSPQPVHAMPCSQQTVHATPCNPQAMHAEPCSLQTVHAAPCSPSPCSGPPQSPTTMTQPAVVTQSAVVLPQQLVVTSVPAAEHSRKPHLGPLMERLLPGIMSQTSGTGCRQGLELFAREVHAGWVAVGDEALRFQQLGLFKQVEQQQHDS